ncbi:MAG: hypothetical protein MPW15_09680 [Candidatus Manganitrophus sp.]|nr:hypothetical protein [Candidatus Manganitrophus sp.]
MTKALAWFFETPVEPRPWWKVITWWELRRIPYNLAVGVVGLISFLFFFLFIHLAHELKPGEDAIEPLALFVAPILINFAYTAGWVSELLLRFFWRSGPHPVGPVLLKLGLIFSIAVVLLPSTLWFVIWLWRTVH